MPAARALEAAAAPFPDEVAAKAERMSGVDKEMPSSMLAVKDSTTVVEDPKEEEEGLHVKNEEGEAPSSMVAVQEIVSTAEEKEDGINEKKCLEECVEENEEDPHKHHKKKHHKKKKKLVPIFAEVQKDIDARPESLMNLAVPTSQSTGDNQHGRRGRKFAPSETSHTLLSTRGGEKAVRRGRNVVDTEVETRERKNEGVPKITGEKSKSDLIGDEDANKETWAQMEQKAREKGPEHLAAVWQMRRNDPQAAIAKGQKLAMEQQKAALEAAQAAGAKNSAAVKIEAMKANRAQQAVARASEKAEKEAGDVAKAQHEASQNAAVKAAQKAQQIARQQAASADFAMQEAAKIANSAAEAKKGKTPPHSAVQTQKGAKKTVITKRKKDNPTPAELDALIDDIEFK